jgi:cell division septum initiation protein DivIVA
MIRGLEKIGEIMRPEEAARENHIRDNEDLAETLRRIEERIVELAREFAARLVEEQSGTSGGAEGGA